MFCPKCGASIADNALFCGSCGAQINTQPVSAPVQQNAQVPYPQPANPQQNPYAAASAKRSKLPLIAIAAVVVVAAVVLALGFGLGWFGKGGSVYVVSEVVIYDADGEEISSTTYERDEHGNTTSMKLRNEQAGMSSTYKYDFDEYGNTMALSVTNKPNNGESTKTKIEFEIELDKDGRLLHSERSDDSGIYTDYSRYGNGMIKEQTNYYDDEKQSELFYDEKGFISENTVYTSGEEMYTATYEWKLDSKGNPESCTETLAWASDEEEERTHTYECDEHGNIIKVYDEEDNLIAERTYVEVKDPSVAARDSAARIGF